MPVTTGGSGPTEGRAAVPVYVVSGGQAPIGQRARRVVVVTSGPVEGGAAKPVYDAGSTALYSNEPALPVYVVQGILGVDPTLAYTNKVKALSPIAYWPLAEASGTVVTDESGNGRHGTYVNATLGATGIGDGRTAATFNGTTSVADVFGASLAAAFSKDEGTIAQWLKVSAAGVWSDGTTRTPMIFQADTNNRARMFRIATNNVIRTSYTAGATQKNTDVTAGPTTAWFHLALTWSKSADQVKTYLNGAQSGATLTSLGTWAGALAVACVGAASNPPPGAGWSGNIAHAAIWASALSAAQIATLAVIP